MKPTTYLSLIGASTVLILGGGAYFLENLSNEKEKNKIKGVEKILSSAETEKIEVDENYIRWNNAQEFINGDPNLTGTDPNYVTFYLLGLNDGKEPKKNKLYKVLVPKNQ